MPPAGKRDNEIRCDCGRLLARRAGASIEIKCRRCDRTIVINIDALPADGLFVEPGQGDVLGDATNASIAVLSCCALVTESV